MTLLFYVFAAQHLFPSCLTILHARGRWPALPVICRLTMTVSDMGSQSKREGAMLKCMSLAIAVCEQQLLLCNLTRWALKGHNECCGPHPVRATQPAQYCHSALEFRGFVKGKSSCLMLNKMLSECLLNVVQTYENAN